MQSNKTKRSQSINLSSMRKSFSVKPLALGVAAIFLSACGDEQEATVFTSVDECTNANPEFAEKCKTAYEDAVQEAERTGPNTIHKEIVSLSSVIISAGLCSGIQARFLCHLWQATC